MPIGKNALKRVTNNGYSNVSVSAPDMEHSTVEPVEEVKVEKKAPATNSADKNPQKKLAATKKTAAPAEKKPVKKAEPKTVKVKPETKEDKEDFTRPEGFVRVELGGDMPIHLL